MKGPPMFTTIATLLTALALLGPVPKPVKDAAPAVIMIAYETTFEGKPATRTCSAFYIDLIHLITAEHCVPQKGEQLVAYATGEPLRVIRETENGLALIESQPATGVVPLKLAKSVEMGERLFSFGYAYGETFVGLQRNAAGKYQGHLWVDGPLASGMSGGPVVNERGEVVGVNQASTPEIGVVCLVPEIKELLK